MGFTEILTIIFVVMKLLGFIGWSWWLVLLPEIIAVALYIGVTIWHLCLCNSINKSIKSNFRKDDWK